MTSDYKLYYPKPKLVSEGNFKDDMQIGEWKYYFNNGIDYIHTIGKEIEQNDIVEEIGKYEGTGDEFSNKKIGIWKKYMLIEGKQVLESEREYCFGKQVLHWKYYNPMTNELRMEGNYDTTGIRDGEWKYYYNDGSTVSEIWKNGKIKKNSKCIIM